MPKPLRASSRRIPVTSFEILEPRRLLATLLVNFENSSSGVEEVEAADFAAADPNVDITATVNGFNQTSTDLIGTDGVEFDVAIQTGSYHTSDAGNYGAQPILDSYLFYNPTDSFRSVTVSSLEEFSAGSRITLTLHGVGDATNQDTEFQLTYNGINLGLQETDYDSAILSDTFVSYSFTKVQGVDSLEIDFRNAGNGGNSGAFGGFSLTSEESQAVRINAGGEEHIDSEGNLFLADQYFSGGRTFSVDNDIFIVGSGNDTSNDEDVDDILYQTERFNGNLGYDIPVVDGIYDVRLHFAEIFFGQENQRVFDVSIEGLTVLDNFDIFGTRFNAFTPGNFASLVLDFEEIEITDSFLNLVFESQGDDGINNAKISAIEVIPVEEPSIVLIPTGGSTVVAEGGTTDTFDVVLTQQPTGNVTVNLTPDNEVAVDLTSLTFTPTNYDVPQTVTVTAIQDIEEEGQQNVPIVIEGVSSDPAYDGRTRTLNVTVIDDDSVEVQFEQRTIATLANPTAGAFGPDGRLYVVNQNAEIRAYTFDNDYNVIDTEIITTISDLDDSGNVLGIAFNPFEQVAPGETATLYVSRSFLFRETTEYESTVVTLTGPNHSVVTDLITGLPVSGFDHGINGLQFDGEGNLLIAVGGNTNTGVFDGVFGSDAPESPLTSAILRARISDPNFNGNIEYEFIDANDPELLDLIDDLGISANPNNQLLGEFVQVVDVAGEVEVDTYAVGLRNSYDLVFTTESRLFATDNGPNGIAQDELNFVSEGDFLGHPSIPRGRLDPRQTLENAEYDPNAPSTEDYTAPLTALPSSSNGIDEYRAQTFNGQLRGQLIAQRFNNQVFFFQLDEAGTGLENINTVNDGSIADGLDILTGPGGVIFGIDRNQNRITIAEPVDDTITATTIYDVFPFRAPAVGGNQFVIGGTNFGDIANTTVLIDGYEAELISVEDNRIVGIFPAVPSSVILRDVTVLTDGSATVLEAGFLPLGDGLNAIENRYVFYNGSSFDGDDFAANSGDDAAIATDKVALLPGQTATFENYTSFVHGINGIIVDAHLADPEAFSADDFALATGNGSDISDFTALDVSVEFNVRIGEGENGSDRITIILPNGSVHNEWLQVCIHATDATGLDSSDVFYFGSVIGETGDSPTSTLVSGIDIGRIRANLSGFSSESIDNVYDINRDGFATGLDIGIVRANLTGFNPVPLITAPEKDDPSTVTTGGNTPFISGSDFTNKDSKGANVKIKTGFNILALAAEPEVEDDQDELEESLAVNQNLDWFVDQRGLTVQTDFRSIGISGLAGGAVENSGVSNRFSGVQSLNSVYVVTKNEIKRAQANQQGRIDLEASVKSKIYDATPESTKELAEKTTSKNRRSIDRFFEKESKFDFVSFRSR